MTTPSLTPPPTAPSRGDAPATFITRANAFIGWFATFVTEIVAAITWIVDQVAACAASATAASNWASSLTTFSGSGSYKGARGYAVDAAASAVDASDAAADAEDAAALAINAPGTSATSVTSLSVGTGTKSPVLAQNNKAFAVGQTVNLARTSAPATRMIGVITGFSNPAGPSPTLTIDVQKAEGSGGPFTDWTISLSGPIARTNVDVIVQDQKTSGTGGQTLTTTTWNTRTLNTLVLNQNSLAALASNQITLPAGSYELRGRASLGTSAGVAAKAKLRFYDVTAGAALGSSGEAVAAIAATDQAGTGTVADGVVAQVFASITLAVTTAIRLEMYVSAGANGGFAVSAGDAEVYSTVEIKRTT